jgi:plastocyanin
MRAGLLVAVVAMALAAVSIPAGAAPGTYVAGEKTVEMSNLKFVPSSLTINKGDKIIFVNKDTMCHDVEIEGGPNSGAVCGMLVGSNWSHVFETVGTFKFRCRAHSSDFASGMVGSVTVLDPNAPPPPPQKTPGFEIVALLGALALASSLFAVARRRGRA